MHWHQHPSAAPFLTQSAQLICCLIWKCRLKEKMTINSLAHLYSNKYTCSTLNKILQPCIGISTLDWHHSDPIGPEYLLPNLEVPTHRKNDDKQPSTFV